MIEQHFYNIIIHHYIKFEASIFKNRTFVLAKDDSLLLSRYHSSFKNRNIMKRHAIQKLINSVNSIFDELL